jgi:hypothetical protein
MRKSSYDIWLGLEAKHHYKRLTVLRVYVLRLIRISYDWKLIGLHWSGES